MHFQFLHRLQRTKYPWVLEGSLAGFLGCIFEVWLGPGARKGLQICGGLRPPHFGRFSRSPGAGQSSKTHPTNPTRFSSGTQPDSAHPGIPVHTLCYAIGLPGRAVTSRGTSPPTFLKVFSVPRGRPVLQNAPNKSDQILFRYPARQCTPGYTRTHSMLCNRASGPGRN